MFAGDDILLMEVLKDCEGVVVSEVQDFLEKSSFTDKTISMSLFLLLSIRMSRKEVLDIVPKIMELVKPEV